MQLRTLQTLAEVASENNSTLVFPLPIEILAGFVNGTIGMSTPGGGTSTPGGGTSTVPLSTVMPAPSVVGGQGRATAAARPTAAVDEAGTDPTTEGSADPRVDDPTDGDRPGADGVSQSA
jgi:hypothetical protein